MIDASPLLRTGSCCICCRCCISTGVVCITDGALVIMESAADVLLFIVVGMARGVSFVFVVADVIVFVFTADEVVTLGGAVTFVLFVFTVLLFFLVTGAAGRIGLLMSLCRAPSLIDIPRMYISSIRMFSLYLLRRKDAGSGSVQSLGMLSWFRRCFNVGIFKRSASRWIRSA